MTKPRVFIGSSKESEKTARTVKKHLSTVCDCVVWTDENVFKANESTYKNLVKNALAFDFAVFIGGVDDFVVRTGNGKTKLATRDNIYLELGLYAGILSTDRTYFLVDEKSRVASDLSGITLYLYSDEKEIEEKCGCIIDAIKKECEVNRIQFLPSTSMAIGYFENFIEPAAKSLFFDEKIIIGKKEYDISKYDKALKVYIPKKLDTDFKSKTEVLIRDNNYRPAELKTELRNTGLVIDFESFKKEKKVILYDCPQTLRAAFRAVELASAQDTVGCNETIKIAKEKEVRNFISTINNMVNATEYTKRLVEIVRF